MMFQKAEVAHRAARNAVNMLVETTVAMELAASCHPLENSNATVRNTVMMTRLKPLTGGSLGRVRAYATTR
jgi:hypothetical protein